MAVTLNVKKRPSIDLLFQLIFGYLGEKITNLKVNCIIYVSYPIITQQIF